MPNVTWQRFFTLIYIAGQKKAVSAAVNSRLSGVLTLPFAVGVCSLPLSSLDSKKGIFFLKRNTAFSCQQLGE